MQATADTCQRCSFYRHSNSATYIWHDWVMPATMSCPAALARPIQRESPRKEMPRPSVLPLAAAAATLPSLHGQDVWGGEDCHERDKAAASYRMQRLQPSKHIQLRLELCTPKRTRQLLPPALRPPLPLPGPS